MGREPKVVVLGGGTSAEKEVSQRSAEAVFLGLRDAAVDVRLSLMEGNELPPDLDPLRQILFLTTHGTFGEDGHLQRLLDAKGFVYTGADAVSSALCFDKSRTRDVAQKAGLRVALGRMYSEEIDAIDDVWSELGPKIILKPNAQGSSIGLVKVESREHLAECLGQIRGTPYLMERFIEGRELTIGVLNGEALAPVEIIPQGGMYDYARKYTKGATQYEAPADIPEEVTAVLRRQARDLFAATGCRDFARVDFRLASDGQLFLLEINTLPGMTATSLLPKSAAAVGYTFPKLLEQMLKGARERFEARCVEVAQP